MDEHHAIATGEQVAEYGKSTCHNWPFACCMCKHWEAIYIKGSIHHPYESVKWEGTCFRFPPKMRIDEDDEWPITNFNGTCGEFSISAKCVKDAPYE